MLERSLLVRRLLVTVLLLGASAASAGPGGSGGNPSLMIASPAKNYLFFGFAPTSQRFAPARDEFAFGLAGFSLSITSVPYDPAHCAATNKFRTVCEGKPGAKGEREATVVFSDHATFILRFTDTGMGAGRLEQVAARVVATFSQGTVQHKTSSKE